MQILRSKTELAEKDFIEQAEKAWNDIPSELGELSTLNSFKNNYKHM